jgi:Type II secretion system (T2SS), protein M subtype b
MRITDRSQRPWLRKLMFIGGNLAAAAVMAWGLVMPIHDFFAERSSQISDQRALLGRLQAIATLNQAVEAASRQIADEAKRGELAVGANEGVVTADLQTQLKVKTEQSGARLRSAQALPTKTVEGTRLVGIRLDILGPLQAIQRTIYAIESGKPYHLVAEAALKPSPGVGVQGIPSEPVIEARLDIFVAVQLESDTP